MNIYLTELSSKDVTSILDTFRSNYIFRDRDVYNRYLEEQGREIRMTYISKVGDRIVGHISINFSPTILNLASRQVAMICDLFVFPQYRCRGIGTTLMQKAELEASKHSDRAALGVGISAEEVIALRMYLKRGYIPMPIGATYNDRTVSKGESVIVNESLLIYMEKRLDKYKS